MDNFDDYILNFQNYKDGNYEYETIASLNDVKIAIENGKKFVFIEAGTKVSIIMGLILIFIGLIISLIIYNIMLTFFFDPIMVVLLFLPITFFSILGFRFIIPGLLKFRKPFIVLGAEGIAYKLKIGGIKGFNWKEISMDFVKKTSELTYMSSTLIYISMPNGDSFKIGRGDYTMKEFRDRNQLGRSETNDLFILTFVNYYNYSKKGSFEAKNF